MVQERSREAWCRRGVERGGAGGREEWCRRGVERSGAGEE